MPPTALMGPQRLSEVTGLDKNSRVRDRMDPWPGLLCPGVSPSPAQASKILKSRQGSAHLLGGLLACRSLLLASRGSPGLAGSGTGAVVLGTCGGAGGGAGFFTTFSLFDRMEGQTWWRGPAPTSGHVTGRPGGLLIPHHAGLLECF